MKVLGISAFYHDSSAALVIDGVVVAAYQEERLTRVKHDPRFPYLSVMQILNDTGLSTDDIDEVVFYEDYGLKLIRLWKQFVVRREGDFIDFFGSVLKLLINKLRLHFWLRKRLGLKCPVLAVRHHFSHGASSYFTSPFSEAVVVTMDGVGDIDTSTITHADGSNFDLIESNEYPESIGLLYSAFTYYCGFKINSGEYKLMGLAPYGEPIYESLIFENLVDLHEDGSFRLRAGYFNFSNSRGGLTDRFFNLFGCPEREAESELTAFYINIAASIQSVTEQIVLAYLERARRLTGCKNVCLAGGVALNCVANGKILNASIFDNVWIQPASGDAGCALGAAFYRYFVDRKERQWVPVQKYNTRLGRSFTDSEIRNFLSDFHLDYSHHPANVAPVVAKFLSEGEVVGWFQGAMEFGPRALGARSILGDPRSPKMQRDMNLKIKFRESFRPFAPVVLSGSAAAWFDIKVESPYMLLVAKVKDFCLDETVDVEATSDLTARLTSQRSKIPAVTHVDGSARVQTVDSDLYPELCELLESFRDLTGCPILINTSFNVRGEPIVFCPVDAWRCFMSSNMDVLVLNDYVIRKDRNMVAVEKFIAHLSSFSLD